MFGLIRYFTHTIRRRYVTESGAFQSLKRPIEVRKLLLFLGVPLAAKIGYDLAVLQDEWRQFDELRAEPGVTIWNKYVVRELRRALDDPRVQAALGHDVTEDAGKTMKENTRTTWRFFHHWRIIEVPAFPKAFCPILPRRRTRAARATQGQQRYWRPRRRCRSADGRLAARPGLRRKGC